MKKIALFDEFATNVYLPLIKQGKRSWSIDERVWRQYLSDSFGSRPITAIKHDEVENWMRGLADSGLSRQPATVTSLCCAQFSPSPGVIA